MKIFSFIRHFVKISKIPILIITDIIIDVCRNFFISLFYNFIKQDLLKKNIEIYVFE